MFLAGLAEKKKKQEKKNGYEAMGMSLGMCFGAAVGTIFPEYIGVTLSMGMLVGLLVGMCVKNCEEDTNEFLPKGGLEGSRMSSLLKSTRNTRALPTGTLRYIRSDYPGNLSDEEVSWLRKNGVTTIIDLREKTEYAQKPCRLETESGFTYYHLPVTGGGVVPESPDSVADAYIKMIDGQMERIICVILKAERNVLYFCGAGKDRTGVVSAILLKQLGFSDSVIIEDYMKTKDNLLDFLKAFAAEHPEVNIHTILPREENIKKVLAALSQIEEKAQSVFTGEADIKKRNIGSNLEVYK